MKQQLHDLAQTLDKATSTDTPRATMKGVADELRRLAADVPDDDGLRSAALELAEQINQHQYGLRGFGDGSLQRGRDLTSKERELITAALRAFGKTEPLSKNQLHYLAVAMAGFANNSQPTYENAVHVLLTVTGSPTYRQG